MGARFTDPLVRLPRFSKEILVRCPHCSGRATVLPPPDNPESRQERRLTCLTCGHMAGWTAPPREHACGYVLPEMSGPR